MGQFDEARGRDRRAVAGWLFACCAVLALLVGVGGITRLTRSGLSIPNWRPVTGILPPIGEAAWKQAFAEYRETPEYRIVNPAMTLDEFRGIFAWEYVHRLLARLLGLIFAVPLAVFAWRRRLPPSAGGPLVAVLAAMALQGAMGWFLVRSGLVAEPRVSPLRLAAHLGLAFLIFGAMLWLALGIGRPRLPRSARRGSLADGLPAQSSPRSSRRCSAERSWRGPTPEPLPDLPSDGGRAYPGAALRPRPLAAQPGRRPGDDPLRPPWTRRRDRRAALGQLAASFARPASRPRHRAALAVAGAALATAGLGITTVLSGVSTVPAAAHQLRRRRRRRTIVSLHVVLQGGAET